MPYFDVGPVRRYGRRRVAFSMSLLFITLIAVLSWMGTPNFAVQTSKDQEIFFELAPTEKIGLVRAVPYPELEALVGTAVTTDNYQSSNIPQSSALWDVMVEYHRLIVQARQTPPDKGGLPNAQAFLIIAQLQPDLVGVTLRTTWDDSKNPGKQLSNSVMVPVHKDSYPSGGGE